MNNTQFPDDDFRCVTSYWDNRYSNGGTSGAGSYGRLAKYKATYINDFVLKKGISKVIEFGCGDGHQLSLCNYPSYIGLDISKEAISLCRKLYLYDLRKQFFLYDHEKFKPNELFTGDLVLSLDVIFHLIDDNLFENYMHNLFNCSKKYVIIYSSNSTEKSLAKHVKHRRFTKWIFKNVANFEIEKFSKSPYKFEPDKPTETSFSDFYIYKIKAS